MVPGAVAVEEELGSRGVVGGFGGSTAEILISSFKPSPLCVIRIVEPGGRSLSSSGKVSPS